MAIYINRPSSDVRGVGIAIGIAIATATDDRRRHEEGRRGRRPSPPPSVTADEGHVEAAEAGARGEIYVDVEVDEGGGVNDEDSEDNDSGDEDEDRARSGAGRCGIPGAGRACTGAGREGTSWACGVKDGDGGSTGEERCEAISHRRSFVPFGRDDEVPERNRRGSLQRHQTPHHGDESRARSVDDVAIGAITTFDAETPATTAALDHFGGNDQSVTDDGGQEATAPAAAATATANAATDAKVKEGRQGQRRKRGGVHLQSRNSDVAFLERRPRVAAAAAGR